MSRSAVVLGATGLVGGALIARLAQTGQWDTVRLLGRRHPPLPDARFSAVDADLGALAEQASAFAVDDVFCCLGTTLKKAGSRDAFRRVDYDFCVAAARCAAEAGARRFIIVSAVNADTGSLSFYARVKGEMEGAVAATDIPLVAFMQPSLLRGARDETRIAEQAGEKVLSLVTPLVGWTKAAWLPIAAETVADAMVALALHGPETGRLRLRYKDMHAYARRLGEDE
jgi:uncharacterized protein YbjT (DUF2867 family)